MVTSLPSDNINQEFDSLLNQSFESSNLKEGTIVKGTIIEIDDESVVIDCGGKTEGRVPRREFTFQQDGNDIQIGDVIDIYLSKFENHNGECELSRTRAISAEIWDDVEKKFNANELITGQVVGKTKGGLVVDAGIQCFLPGSQVSTRQVRDITPLLNVPLKFSILKIDRKKNNVVISRRAVMEEQDKSLREEQFKKYSLGDIIKAEVKALTAYGAFVSIGDDGYTMDSLLHLNEISFRRINHPAEALNVGDSLKVKVISIDESKKRISVSLKSLEDDPWDQLKDKFKPGDIVPASITSIQDYGLFAEIIPGCEGLVHKSELSFDPKKNERPGSLFARSQKIEVKILDIDLTKRKLGLSIKQTQPSPFIEFNKLNPVGSIIDTEISSIKDNIIFCALGPEIDGALFDKNLSWENDPKEEIKKYKLGDKVKAKIISNDNDKISLSVREIDGNPFDVISDKKIGDIVTCNVVDVGDYGIKVRVKGGGPTAVIKKNELALRKADQRPDRFGKNDTVDAKIVSLDLSFYKMNLSIKTMEEEIEREAMEKFGSSNSGASLGDILGKALSSSKEEKD